jgi:hypothetical protein
MNPKAPNLNGLIKIHKLGSPIRPIINWQYAPAYRLAKLLSEKLQHELQLPYAFNIKNSQHLLTELENIEGHNNLRLASFDITNMYTNIPTSKLPHIIEKVCKYQNTPRDTWKELTKIVKTILKQNYFNFENNTYTQPEGLAMGAPTSAIFSELYFQKIEHTDLTTILVNNNIT